MHIERALRLEDESRTRILFDLGSDFERLGSGFLEDGAADGDFLNVVEELHALGLEAVNLQKSTLRLLFELAN